MGFKPTVDRTKEIAPTEDTTTTKLPETSRRPHRPLPLASSSSDTNLPNSAEAQKVSLALPLENQQPSIPSTSTSQPQLPATQQTPTAVSVASSAQPKDPSSDQKPSVKAAPPMTQGNPPKGLILQSDSRTICIQLPAMTPEMPSPSKSPAVPASAATTAAIVPSSAASVESSQSSQQTNPQSNNKRKKNPPVRGISSGRWTDSEHQAFLKGLQLYGREWKKVASHIPTRTSAQVRSHAQKYFTKMQRDQDAFLILSSHQQQQQQQQQGDASGEQTSSLALGGQPASSSLSPATAASLENSTERLSPGIQATVARILANPESVEAEVEDTLQRLRERYRLLQARLQQTDRQSQHQPSKPSPYHTSHRKRPAVDAASLGSVASATLQDEELIAVSVLQAALPQSGNSSRASAAEEDETTHTADDTTTHSHSSSTSSHKRSRMSSF